MSEVWMMLVVASLWTGDGAAISTEHIWFQTQALCERAARTIAVSQFVLATAAPQVRVEATCLLVRSRRNVTPSTARRPGPRTEG